MVERNCFDFRYMEGLTHHVGSIDAPSRKRYLNREQRLNIKKHLTQCVWTGRLTFSYREEQILRPR
jgi:hypothetical protein